MILVNQHLKDHSTTENMISISYALPTTRMRFFAPQTMNANNKKELRQGAAAKARKKKRKGNSSPLSQKGRGVHHHWELELEDEEDEENLLPPNPPFPPFPYLLPP